MAGWDTPYPHAFEWEYFPGQARVAKGAEDRHGGRMSRYVFKMPDLGEGTVSAEVVEWKVKVGDVVTEDQIIAEVMTDKAAVEIPAPVTGRVRFHHRPAGRHGRGRRRTDRIRHQRGAAAAEPASAPKPASGPAPTPPAAKPQAAAAAVAPAASHARDGVAGDATQGACRGRRSRDGQRLRSRAGAFRRWTSSP